MYTVDQKPTARMRCTNCSAKMLTLNVNSSRNDHLIKVSLRQLVRPTYQALVNRPVVHKDVRVYK